MIYKNDFGFDDEVLSSVRRYENMLKNNASYFFDVHEFEDIIDYYLDTENFSEAIQAVEYAKEIHPNASSIQMRQAEVLIDNGQPVEALRILSLLERFASGEYEIYLLKGTALNMLGKAKEANRQFEKAMALANENKEDVLYNIGISFERINQHKVALKYFLKLYAIDPDNYFVCYDLAYCYEKLNDFEKSVTFYLKYLDEDPFSEYVWYNLGIVYNKLDENEKALEAYDYAIAITENYSSAHFNKANTLSLLNRYREAIDCYEEFLKIEPDSTAAYCYMGECYERLDNYEMACKHYLTSISLDGRFADSWFGLGVVNAQQNKHEDAINHLSRAVEMDSNNTEYLFALASEYANIQKYEEAVNIFRQLAHLIATDEVMWDSFAMIYIQQQDHTTACKILDEGISFSPDSIMLQYRLAGCLLHTKHEDQAIVILEKLLPLSSKDDIDYLYDICPLTTIDSTVQSLIHKHTNHQ